MNHNPRSSPPPVLTIRDVYYLLFRHKWKILLISVLGILAGLLLDFLAPVPYESEAKLFVKYVVDARAPVESAGADTRRTPDERGETVLNTEIEILTSLDVAEQTAKVIGPAKILGPRVAQPDSHLAAVAIAQGLVVEAPRRSSVIRIAYRHADRTLVQPVLAELIQAYLKRHLEIHRDFGEFDEFLTRQTDQLRQSLSDTEEQLRKVKAKAGVISVEDTKRLSAEQITRLRQELLDAEAELAQNQAAAGELSRILHNIPLGQTNTLAVGAKTNAPVPTATVDQYKEICSLLDSLTRKEQDMLITFTPESSLVKTLHNQILENKKRKQQLESDNPGLLTTEIVESPRTTAAGSETSPSPRMELAAETSRVAGLQSKIKILSERLDAMLKQASLVNEAEPSITDLQRKKELEEAHYRYFSEKLEQSRIDQALVANRVSNINSIQAPSPPFRDTAKLKKIAFLVMFAGVGIAFALPVMIELYLDRSLRRPKDIETHLGLPLFMSIPYLSLNGSRKALTAGKPLNLLAEKNGSEKSPNGKAGHEPGQVEPVGNGFAPNEDLRPFCDGLRERLITSFELRNLNKKPKLVAVTSCGRGTGVSGIAAGLAGSLSETGDGNVLLVDMNIRRGAAHQFRNGELLCGIEDVLEANKREGAQVSENLYVVSETGANDKAPAVLPHRLRHLVPKLKASDFDYIIFDMPPVSQTTVTPRVARFMDTVLMVVESEHTERDDVHEATTLLGKMEGELGVILNKYHPYVPKRLRRGLE